MGSECSRLNPYKVKESRQFFHSALQSQGISTVFPFISVLLRARSNLVSCKMRSQIPILDVCTLVYVLFSSDCLVLCLDGGCACTCMCVWSSCTAVSACMEHLTNTSMALHVHLSDSESIKNFTLHGQTDLQSMCLRKHRCEHG